MLFILTFVNHGLAVGYLIGWFVGAFYMSWSVVSEEKQAHEAGE